MLNMYKTEMLLAVTVVILATFVKNGSAVRCWTCSSDLDTHCADTFNATSPLNTHRYILQNCNTNTGSAYPYLQPSKSVCKKAKQYVNGEMTVIRACAWIPTSQPAGTCPPTSTPSYIRQTFCETCEYDACNGAPAAGLALAAAVAGVAALLAR